MDEKVEQYIEKQESPQKEILQRLRNIFKKTLSDCREKSAWGVVTYANGKFYIGAIRGRVHVGFAINGLDKEEIDLFEGTGKTMRHIKIHSLEEIDEKNLVKLIKLVDTKAICSEC